MLQVAQRDGDAQQVLQICLLRQAGCQGCHDLHAPLRVILDQELDRVVHRHRDGSLATILIRVRQVRPDSINKALSVQQCHMLR